MAGYLWGARARDKDRLNHRIDLEFEISSEPRNPLPEVGDDTACQLWAPRDRERESARRGRKWSWAAAGPRRAARAGEKEMGRSVGSAGSFFFFFYFFSEIFHNFCFTTPNELK